MSAIKMLLTLELTAHAGYDTMVSNEFTPSCLLARLDASGGTEDFGLSPVTSVWALCHVHCMQL